MGTKPPRTVLSKLLITSLWFLAFAHVAFFFVLRDNLISASFEKDQRAFFDLATLIGDEAASRSPSVSRDTVETVANEHLRFNPGATVLLTDLDGNVRMAVPRGPSPFPALPRSALEQMQQRELPDLPIFLTLPSSAGGRSVFSSARLRVEGADCYLVVLLPAHTARFLSTRDGTIALALRLIPLMLVSLCITAGLVGLVGRFQMRSLRTLADTARRYLAGDSRARVPELPQGEIGDLGRALTKFSDEVASLELQIRATEEQRRTLLASVAHDLGAPLTALSGFVALQSEAGPSVKSANGTSGSRTYLAGARDALHRIFLMLDNLGELSRESVDSLQVSFSELRLSEMVASLGNENSIAASRKGLTLTVELPEEELRIIADHAMIERAIQNLLSNAIRYTPAGGTVRLVLSKRTSVLGNSYAVLQVSDTGIGVEPHELPHLFDEFVRANAHRSDDPGGSGLGLAIVKRFIQLHNGSIAVESKVDIGSTFTVTLPENPSASAGPQAAHKAPVHETLWRCGSRAIAERIPALLRSFLMVIVIGGAPYVLGRHSSMLHLFFGAALGIAFVAAYRILRAALERAVLCAGCSSLALFSTAHIFRPELLAIGALLTGLIAILVAASLSRELSIALPLRGMATLVGGSLLCACVIFYHALRFHIEKEQAVRVGQLQMMLGDARTLLETAAQGRPIEMQSSDAPASPPTALDRAVLTLARIAPLSNILVLDRHGIVLRQTGIFDPPYYGFTVAKAPSDAPADDNSPERRDIFRPDVRVRREAFAFPSPHAASFELAGTAFSIREIHAGERLIERRVLYLLAQNALLPALVAAIIGFTVFRSLRARIRFGTLLLGSTDPRMPFPLMDTLPVSKRRDELDDVLSLLVTLRDRVLLHEEELRRSAAAKRSLVQTVYRALERPLQELSRLLTPVDVEAANAISGISPNEIKRAAEITEATRLLVRELVEYARVSSGHESLETEPFDLADLIHDVAAKHFSGSHSGCPSDDHTGCPAIVIPAKLPWVETDLTIVNRVLDLLLQTAKHASQPPTLELTVESGALVRISMRTTPDAVTDERAPDLAFAAIRSALIEAYLHLIGANLYCASDTLWSFLLPLYKPATSKSRSIYSPPAGPPEPFSDTVSQ